MKKLTLLEANQPDKIRDSLSEIVDTVDAIPNAVTKESIGLGKVNNTSDADKPISDAQRAYIASELSAETAARIAGDEAIKEKIPTQATASNQLADKDFVNSSVQNMAAKYVVPTQDGDSQWSSLAALRDGPWYYRGMTYTPTEHDYAVFINTDNTVWRAAFDGENWSVQYKVNDTPFTAAQLAVLNSGITAELVSEIGSGGTAVTVGGVVQETFDADTKVDVGGYSYVPLSEVKVGDNLRGKTLVFATTTNPLEGLEAGYDEEGEIWYISVKSEDSTHPKSLVSGALWMFGLEPNNAFGILNEEEWVISEIFYDTQWRMTEYTYPDDQDYIVSYILPNYHESASVGSLIKGADMQDRDYGVVRPRTRIGNVDLSKSRTLAEIGAADRNHASTTTVFGESTNKLLGHSRTACDVPGGEFERIEGQLNESHYRKFVPYGTPVDLNDPQWCVPGFVTIYTDWRGFGEILNAPPRFNEPWDAIYAIHIHNYYGEYGGNGIIQEMFSRGHAYTAVPNQRKIWRRATTNLGNAYNQKWFCVAGDIDKEYVDGLVKKVSNHVSVPYSTAIDLSAYTDSEFVSIYNDTNLNFIAIQDAPSDMPPTHALFVQNMRGTNASQGLQQLSVPTSTDIWRRTLSGAGTETRVVGDWVNITKAEAVQLYYHEVYMRAVVEDTHIAEVRFGILSNSALEFTFGDNSPNSFPRLRTYLAGGVVSQIVDGVTHYMGVSTILFVPGNVISFNINSDSTSDHGSVGFVELKNPTMDVLRDNPRKIL